MNVYLSKLTIILVRVIKAMTFSKYFFLFSLSLLCMFCSNAVAERKSVCMRRVACGCMAEGC